MDVVKDKVVDFSSESKTSKAGKHYTVHSVVLETFGPVTLGFTKPETLPFSKGDHVTMQVDFNYGKYEFKSLESDSTPATLVTPPSKKSFGGKGGGSPRKDFKEGMFPIPDDHGDMAILHQNALTNAIKLAELRMDHEFGNGDHLATDNIIELAYELVEFTSGKHLEKLAK